MLLKGNNLYWLEKLMPVFAQKINLIYIDPPYNTQQNFNISANGKANAISRERNAKCAYDDNMSFMGWQSMMRGVLEYCKDLLADTGSIYVHLDDKVAPYIKVMMDDIFGIANYKNMIVRVKCSPKNFYRRAYGNTKDIILFYSKNYKKNIWNELKEPLTEQQANELYNKEDENGRYATMSLSAPGQVINGSSGKPWRDVAPPTWQTLGNYSRAIRRI